MYYKYTTVYDPITKIPYLASNEGNGIVYIDVSRVVDIPKSQIKLTRTEWNEYLSLVSIGKSQEAIKYFNKIKKRKIKESKPLLARLISFMFVFISILTILFMLSTLKKERYETIGQDTIVVIKEPYINKNLIDSVYNTILKKSYPVIEKVDSFIFKNSEKIDSLNFLK